MPATTLVGLASVGRVRSAAGDARVVGARVEVEGVPGGGGLPVGAHHLDQAEAGPEEWGGDEDSPGGQAAATPGWQGGGRGASGCHIRHDSEESRAAASEGSEKGRTGLSRHAAIEAAP